ncbi:MAG: hypothetical protein H7Z11_06700 [Verrucomicrobia bacterium]|nr:hypothetical protein [Leptolyngbya sp. ES-bin-22]
MGCHCIKSGPNWGNGSQIRRMVDNFNKAKRVLRSNVSSENIVVVNGFLYGRDNQPGKGKYLKFCGQRFWELISDDELFIQILQSF